MSSMMFFGSFLDARMDWLLITAFAIVSITLWVASTLRASGFLHDWMSFSFHEGTTFVITATIGVGIRTIPIQLSSMATTIPFSWASSHHCNSSSSNSCLLIESFLNVLCVGRSNICSSLLFIWSLGWSHTRSSRNMLFEWFSWFIRCFSINKIICTSFS